MKSTRKLEILKELKRTNNVSDYPGEIVDLSNNQSPFGKYKEYPKLYRAYEKVSKYLNVSKSSLLLTRGCEEAIKFSTEALLDRDVNFVRPYPTFGMLEVFEQLNDCEPNLSEYKQNLCLNLDDFLSRIRSNSVVYIANPDNPTGSVLDQTQMDVIINKVMSTKSLLIYDETYDMFSNVNPKLPIVDNVIRVGSFSKSHGLAGLRIGYLISSLSNIKLLSKLSPIDEINSVGAKELEKIQINNRNAVKNYNQVRKWRDIFAREFPEYVIYTNTNFINLKFERSTAKKLYHYLLSLRIKTRYYEHPRCMDGVLRITIGRNRVMKKILRLIKANFMI